MFDKITNFLNKDLSKKPTNKWYEDHPKKEIIEYVSSWKPNSNRVYIVVHEKEKIAQNNIYHAQISKSEQELLTGTVVAVGEGYYTESGKYVKTTSKPGDIVLIDKMSGINIRVDKTKKILPFSEEITEDRLPLRIARQESILNTFPPDHPL